MKILGVSRQRISQLLEVEKIGTQLTGIQLELVEKYKLERKNGRPEGSYKKKGREV